MSALRTITGFRLDEEGDWVADLACLHSQHMRHNPPMVSPALGAGSGRPPGPDRRGDQLPAV